MMLSVWSAMGGGCTGQVPLVSAMEFWRPFPWMQIDVICGEGTVYRAPACQVHEGLQVLQPLSPMLMTTSGQTELVEPGAVHFTSPLEPCSARGVQDYTYRARVMFIGSDVLSRAGAQAVHTGALRAPRHSAMYSASFAELQRRAVPADCVVRFMACLRELLTAEPERTRAEQVPEGVVRARDYLRSHATEQVSLEALAKEAFLSKYHLLRSFHRALGLTPHEYQMQLRLARARRLLAEGRSISRATYDAGFSDQSHLTRRFIAFYGMTPARYARQVRAPIAGPPHEPMRDDEWSSVSAA